MRRLGIFRLGLLLVLALVIAAGCVHGEGEEGGGGGQQAAGGQQGGQRGSVLDRVKDRGRLICGVNDSVPGFGFVTEAGE